MTRDDVLTVVNAKAVELIPGYEATPEGTARSFVQYGASSLDVVELVSVVMRELRLKVPRTDLADIVSVDDLATVLLSCSKRPE